MQPPGSVLLMVYIWACPGHVERGSESELDACVDECRLPLGRLLASHVASPFRFRGGCDLSQDLSGCPVWCFGQAPPWPRCPLLAGKDLDILLTGLSLWLCTAPSRASSEL